MLSATPSGAYNYLARHTNFLELLPSSTRHFYNIATEARHGKAMTEHLSGLPRANSAFRQFSGRAALRENLSWPAQRNSSKAEKKGTWFKMILYISIYTYHLYHSISISIWKLGLSANQEPPNDHQTVRETMIYHQNWGVSQFSDKPTQIPALTVV